MTTCADLATRLAAAEEALHNLMIGSAFESVQDGENSVKFRAADVPRLETYIGRLKLTMARKRCAGCSRGGRVIGIVQVDSNC